jgi:hypothetical protein
LINEHNDIHCVTISKSTPYFSTEAPPPIIDATVTISTDNQVFTLVQDDTIPGSYFTDLIVAEPSKTYVLDVYLDFDNDGVQEHYQASSKMTHGPRVDSIVLSPIVIDKVPILFLYGEVFDDTENNFCIYAGKSSDEQQGLFDYFMIPSSYLRTRSYVYQLPFFVEDGIHKGDTINFRVDNLGNDYAVFLSECSEEMSTSNPFFSPPPAEVVTNIKCLNSDIKVSGFFAAYSKGIDMTTISDINFEF